MRHDDGGDAVFVGDFVDELVNFDARGGVEAGIGFVAKQVGALRGNGPGNAHALLHAARNLGGHLVAGVFQTHALQAKLHPLAALFGAHFGRQHLQREFHVLRHRHGIEQGRALEKHPDFAPDFLPDVNLAVGVHRAIESDGADIGLHQAHDALEQHAFAGARAAEQQVALAGFEHARNPFQHGRAVEGLFNIGYFNHKSMC